jgi:hypothetical protein
MRTIFLREKITIIAFEIAEHRSSLTYDLLVGAGIKLPKVTGEAEKIACVYEFEHGITINSTGNSLLQMIIMLNYFSYN